MVKDHSDSERGNYISYSFRLAARVLLYAHPTDRIAHTTALLHQSMNTETRSSSRIDPMTHRTMSERSYHWATSRSHNSETLISVFVELKSTSWLTILWPKQPAVQVARCDREGQHKRISLSHSAGDLLDGDGGQVHGGPIKQARGTGLALQQEVDEGTGTRSFCYHQSLLLLIQGHKNSLWNKYYK